MTALEYKLLGLLARQPMSGYDLAKILKKSFIPFGSVSHTQIYPALASLRQQGHVRYHIVEQHSGRPNKTLPTATARTRIVSNGSRMSRSSAPEGSFFVS